MNRFVIETTYHLPVYRQRLYEAASVEEACSLAVADEGWEDENTAVETSGETFVNRIWENTERAYQGKAGTIPQEFQENIQRKAGLFDSWSFFCARPRSRWAFQHVTSRSRFRRWWSRWLKRMPSPVSR